MARESGGGEAQNRECDAQRRDGTPIPMSIARNPRLLPKLGKFREIRSIRLEKFGGDRAGKKNISGKSLENATPLSSQRFSGKDHAINLEPQSWQSSRCPALAPGPPSVSLPGATRLSSGCRDGGGCLRFRFRSRRGV